MLATVSSPELAEWRIMEALDPPLSMRVDLVGGIVASTIANVNRSRGHKPFKETDFMPLLEKPKAAPETPEQVGTGLIASIRETKKRIRKKKP